MSLVLLAWYCVFILLASIAGGTIPAWVRLTHRGMELAVSFVAGVMLGVALFHLLPHATVEAVRAAPPGLLIRAVQELMLAVTAGLLAMFFIERFFCYHHHETPAELDDHAAHDHGPARDRTHDISWSGAALGFTLHSLLEGVAVSAAVEHGGHGATLAGLGTFLVVFLHKPLDSMTITMLMQRGGWSPGWRNVINGLFALVIPLGMLVFYIISMASPTTGNSGVLPARVLALALAFSAGMFLCISLSDLLPELQFHQHDRIKLSVALMLGLLVAYGAGWLETTIGGAHQHGKVPPTVAQTGSQAPAWERTDFEAPPRTNNN